MPLGGGKGVTGQQAAVTTAQRLGSARVTQIVGDRRVQLGLPAVPPRAVVADTAGERGDGLWASDGLEQQIARCAVADLPGRLAELVECLSPPTRGAVRGEFGTSPAGSTNTV
jgi:hypothetical protein